MQGAVRRAEHHRDGIAEQRRVFDAPRRAAAAKHEGALARADDEAPISATRKRLKYVDLAVLGEAVG